MISLNILGSIIGTKLQVLLIAYRLETVLMTDRVFLLGGGQLEEVAKSSLIAHDGQYALKGI